jgi:hypothetical protein
MDYRFVVDLAEHCQLVHYLFYEVLGLRRALFGKRFHRVVCLGVFVDEQPDGREPAFVDLPQLVKSLMKIGVDDQRP